MLNSIVKINDLHKSFDDLVVLDGVSLNVEMGQNMVVFGRSGTGNKQWKGKRVSGHCRPFGVLRGRASGGEVLSVQQCQRRTT